ncbi:MAG: pyridoxal-phosphate dependent enzyme [Chitinophagaceae bacterium]|nr:pyridoxal-phosphate dependent enzyme [Chitinophagaceae bacterium]
MKISADVLRLDKIHRDISGNKWFKLKYHLEEAMRLGKKGIVTFGGAYSNHLVATAVAAHEHRLLSTGIIRGEQTSPENESIKHMRAAGMQIVYVTREEYHHKDEIAARYLAEHTDFYYVPEGGRSAEGVKGAEEILSRAGNDNYTHIICPVGTGATLAGLINASAPHQQVIGISALKVANQNDNELAGFLHSNTLKNNWSINYGYHFGGYAKRTNELIEFMNALYLEEKIPTDFVYTGKMFFAVYDLVARNYFKPGSKLLIIHTGGLQGNKSLPEGTLVF